MKTRGLWMALMALMMCFVSNEAYAYDIAVENANGVTIYYNYINEGKELEVTYETTSYNSYSGSVVIPEEVTYGNQTRKVTSIGNYAFSGCRSLTSVTIPNSVTSIGNYAFQGCSGLTSVHITDLAAWCKISFSYSSSNPLSFAHHLYLNNQEITDLIIPEGVTNIGRWAFKGCTGLTSVTIGNSVTSIGNSAFSYCSGLTSVTIPGSVTSIGNSAFAGCISLTSVTIPGSVTSIGESAFYKCSGLTSVHITDLAAWCKISFSSSASNPLFYANHLYLNNQEITDLIIPEGVTSIGKSAFSGCGGLTSVTIPNSVTSIGGSAFYNCSGLTSVTIPNSVTSIGSSAFQSCSRLRSVTIPHSVTSIGQYAFENCSGLTSVTIPNSVTSIGLGAFSYCSSLTSVTVDCPTVGNWFAGKGSIQNVILGNHVTSIGESAFQNCISLTSVTIPGSVTSIGSYAFSGCGLTSVTIPNSVTSIGEWAFSNCSRLTSVTIPGSVKSIGGGAFYECRRLTSVTIPGSVTSIGDQAFYWCSNLTSVTIGNSVTSIGEWAFYGCSGLTDVYCFAERVPTTGDDVFLSTPISTATLHVPASAIDAYKTEPWNGFKEIVALTDKELAVDAVHGEESMDQAPIYDLGGRRLAAPRKGINIVGGKKVLMR